MENLKELVLILSKHKIKAVETLNTGLPKSSKLLALYNGICDKKFLTDEDALENLYPEGNGKMAYDKLKSRLQNRLINTIFFIDINKPAFNEYQKAYYNCSKNWAATRVLAGRGASSPSVALAKKTLVIAQKYEFTQITLDLLRLLRSKVAFLKNSKEFMTYNELTRKYTKILNAELKAEEYKNMLMLDYENCDIEQYLKELEELSREVNSYNFTFDHYRIKVTHALKTDQYVQAKIHCKEAIEFVKSRTHTQNKTFLLFLYQHLMLCCTQLKEYTQGREAVEEALKLIEDQKGTNNWFTLQHSFFIICLHSNQLNKAEEIFHATYNHPRLGSMYQELIETWKTNEAYLNFFIKIGKIKPNPKFQLRKFRLSKFVNEVPKFSNDKRGANINILIIQILFLLQQKKYDNVIDRVESLNMYCSRYLRNDDTLRSNCFIKMLLQIPKAHFNKMAVERKVRRYKEKLLSSPLEIAKQTNSIEIEIIPYEQLWDYVIGSLDNKFHYLK